MVALPHIVSWATIRRTSFVVSSLLVLSVSLNIPSYTPNRAQASGSCQVVSISPPTAPNGSDTTFAIDITDASDDIAWVRVDSPSPNLVIINGASDFLPNASIGSSTAIFTGGPVSAGTTMEVDVEGIISYFPTSNWTIQASTDSGGANPMTCTGDTSLTINDSTPPNILTVSASAATTTATINWTTDKTTTGSVSYGKTTSYGATQADNNPGTGHQVILTGLSPATTYHYQITASDQFDNTGMSIDSTFFTAAQPTGGGNPSGGGNSNGGSSLNVKVTNPGDKTPPSIKLTSTIPAVITNEPTIAGTADDNLAVAKVEYSMDGGQNWLPVDMANGLGGKHVAFSFTPLNLDDGTYTIVARAVDGGGNMTSTSRVTAVIDRFPPTVGGNVISLGPQILVPDDNGVMTATTGVDLAITLTAGGGATKVSVDSSSKLIGKTTLASNFTLQQASDSGLWSGTMSFSKPGLYQLVAHATDGAGNQNMRTIGTVNVIRASTVMSAAGPLANAHIMVYSRDADSGGWDVWDGLPYGQTNPQATNKQGNFQAFLPAGTYYIHAAASGYQDVNSTTFTLTEPTPIASILRMQAAPHIGPLSLPSFSFAVVPLINTKTTRTIEQATDESTLIGQSLPTLKLTDTTGQTQNSTNWLGKPTLITLLTTWAPSSAEQLSVLDTLASNSDISVKVIGLQENAARLRAYDAIDGSTLTWLADPNNQTVDMLHAGTVPTHLFVDRKGVVRAIVHGVLNEQQIIDTLTNEP